MLDLHWAVLQFWEQSVRFTLGSLTVLETKCKIYTGLFYSSGNKVLDLLRTVLQFWEQSVRFTKDSFTVLGTKC